MEKAKQAKQADVELSDGWRARVRRFDSGRGFLLGFFDYGWTEETGMTVTAQDLRAMAEAFLTMADTGQVVEESEHDASGDLKRRGYTIRFGSDFTISARGFAKAIAHEFPLDATVREVVTHHGPWPGAEKELPATKTAQIEISFDADGKITAERLAALLGRILGRG